MPRHGAGPEGGGEGNGRVGGKRGGRDGGTEDGRPRPAAALARTPGLIDPTVASARRPGGERQGQFGVAQRSQSAGGGCRRDAAPTPEDLAEEGPGDGERVAPAGHESSQEMGECASSDWVGEVGVYLPRRTHRAVARCVLWGLDSVASSKRRGLGREKRNNPRRYPCSRPRNPLL